MANNKYTYRMSSAGKCPKALSAERNGLEPEAKPAWLTIAAKEGNLHEAAIKEGLRNNCYSILDEQKEYIIEQSTYNIVGHIDGLALGDNHTQRLLEIKTMSQFEFDRWMHGGFAAFPNYAGQIACYMYAAKLEECMYIVKNRNSGYIDTRLVKQNNNMLFQIQPILDKLAKIEELALAGELYPMNYDVDNIDCKRCSYKYLCLPSAKELNDIDKRTLQAAIDRWREGKLLEARAKSLIENSKKLLEAYAKEQPEKRFTMSSLLVTMYSVPEAPINYVRKAYTACKITDFNKEDDNDKK